MAKLPEPPSPEALASMGADLHVLRSGTRIWRIYFQAGAHPTTWAQFRSWGPSDARFDHHEVPASVQARQILYGAVGPQAALSTIAEVFQATRVVERRRRSPAVVAFEIERKLRLLDLTGTWPTRAGASMALSSGRRDRARRWSRAIYAAFPDIDGLVYSSSMNANQPCVALYERAKSAMPRHPVFHRLLSDPAIFRMLRNACATCGYLLV